MDPQNLAYALVQVVHNFGALAVAGGATAAFLQLRAGAASVRPHGWLVAAGWAVQGASGAGFGAISYAWYGQFPDLHAVAVAAVGIKMACASIGFLAAAAYLKFGHAWSVPVSRAVWGGLVALASTALSAAAFLRWFA